MIWYEYRSCNATTFPPFAPCFKCHRSSEENVSFGGSGLPTRELSFLSSFWLRGFSRSPRYFSFTKRLSTLCPFCSVPPTRPVLLLCPLSHCEPLRACPLVQRTEGVCEWGSLFMHKQIKKNSYLTWVTACCSRFIEMYTTKFLFV